MFNKQIDCTQLTLGMKEFNGCKLEAAAQQSIHDTQQPIRQSLFETVLGRENQPRRILGGSFHLKIRYTFQHGRTST